MDERRGSFPARLVFCGQFGEGEGICLFSYFFREMFWLQHVHEVYWCVSGQSHVDFECPGGASSLQSCTRYARVHIPRFVFEKSVAFYSRVDVYQYIIDMENTTIAKVPGLMLELRS